MKRVSRKTAKRGGGGRRRRTMKGGNPSSRSNREIPAEWFVDDGKMRRIPSSFLNERSMVPDQTQHLSLQFLNTRISTELNDLRQQIKKLNNDIKELKLNNNLMADTVSSLAIVPHEDPNIGVDFFEPLIRYNRGSLASTRLQNHI